MLCWSDWILVRQAGARNNIICIQIYFFKCVSGSKLFDFVQPPDEIELSQFKQNLFLVHLNNKILLVLIVLMYSFFVNIVNM